MSLFKQLFSPLFLCLALSLLLSGCGGGGGSGSSSSGSSSVGAPTSLIGKKVVMTVTKSSYVPSSPGATISITQPGGTIEYTLVSSTQVIGKGLLTIPTISWSWALFTGNAGKLYMHMQYGDTTDTYTFTSSTGGTWHQSGSLVTGTTFQFDGTFTIATSSGTTGSGSTGSGSTGSGTTGSGTTSPTTGQITIWNSRSTTQSGSTSVRIDNASVGSLNQYYTSAPTCGMTSNGAAITRTLSVGTHSFSAADGNLTWGPSSFSITAGGCLLYQLR